MPTILAHIDHEAFAPFLEQATGSDLFDPSFDRPWAFSHRSDREPGLGAGHARRDRAGALALLRLERSPGTSSTTSRPIRTSGPMLLTNRPSKAGECASWRPRSWARIPATAAPRVKSIPSRRRATRKACSSWATRATRTNERQAHSPRGRPLPAQLQRRICGPHERGVDRGRRPARRHAGAGRHTRHRPLEP